jgi:glyoxylase-like metal-dependent hydrolase (beta-lactamase superfamily II)
MFTGDTVFRVEVGRTDLYSGDENVQRISLERIVNTLSNGVENFYAGHGTNFNKEELNYNISRILGDD